MNKHSHRSYDQENHWRKYAPFFSRSACADEANAPVEEYFSFRGAQVHVDRYTNHESPFVIVLVHGAGGYGRLLAPYARLVHQAGYEVVAPDLPGYGLSSNETRFVDCRFWVEVLRELAASEYRNSGRRIVFVGASLGGFLAYVCAVSMPEGTVAGLVATTLADPRDSITRQQFARNSIVLRVGLPLLPMFARCMGGLRLPIRWFTKMNAMSNQAALSRLVAADPLGAGVSLPLRFMQSIFELRPTVEPEKFLRFPVLLAHPGADRWTPMESSRIFFDRLQCEKTLVVLDQCGHFPVEEPGFSQLERSVVAFLEELKNRPQ